MLCLRYPILLQLCCRLKACIKSHIILAGFLVNFGYISSFRLWWFAVLFQKLWLRVVVLLIKIGLAAGLCYLELKGSLVIHVGTTVSHRHIFCHTTKNSVFTPFFFSSPESILELESAVSRWSERELMHNQAQHQLQSLNVIQALPSLSSSSPQHQSSHNYIQFALQFYSLVFAGTNFKDMETSQLALTYGLSNNQNFLWPGLPSVVIS